MRRNFFLLYVFAYQYSPPLRNNLMLFASPSSRLMLYMSHSSENANKFQWQKFLFCDHKVFFSCSPWNMKWCLLLMLIRLLASHASVCVRSLCGGRKSIKDIWNVMHVDISFVALFHPLLCLTWCWDCSRVLNTQKIVHFALKLPSIDFVPVRPWKLVSGKSFRKENGKTFVVGLAWGKY